ncbi:hypothetical protein [Nostoc sp. CHAB 5715]|nr:hypothetical protein [Nostoc sp. CHAB 5715]
MLAYSSLFGKVMPILHKFQARWLKRHFKSDRFALKENENS